ncbi:MAG: DUF2079 domain-containing protein [Eubacteriales bacterium]
MSVFDKLRKTGKSSIEILQSGECPILLLSAYLFVGSINLLVTEAVYFNPFFYETVSFTLFAGLTALIFVSLVIFRTLSTPRFSYVAMVVSSTLFAWSYVFETPTITYLLAGVLAILFFFTYYAFRDGSLAPEESERFKKNTYIACLIAGAVVVGFFLSYITILRYKAYFSSTYDFGIFTQMYYYMAKTGLPLVTCERDRLLSHFAVHFSPVYYLFLPFYLLYQKPETLLVIQAVAVAASAFPIYMIARKHSHSRLISLTAALIGITYPAFFRGVYYDFHENVFLLCFILWALYFFDERKYIPAWIFVLLTLSVKEDAGLYVFFIGMYYLASGKDKKAKLNGLATGFIALVYFIAAIKFLESFGLGPMISRYNNFMTVGDSSFVDLVKNLLKNPGHLVYSLFTEEKLNFIIQVFAPLMFIPLLTKTPKLYLLACPLIVINLLPGYQYQHIVGYQYVFGSGALLVYMFIKNLSEIKRDWLKHHLAYMSLTASLMITFVLSSGSSAYYVNAYSDSAVDIKATNECLDRVPDDAEVTSATFLVPYLSDRDVIYMYPSKNETEYLVIDNRYLALQSERDELQEHIDRGYELVDSGGYAMVYKLSGANTNP